jgi:hypothetical protein
MHATLAQTGYSAHEGSPPGDLGYKKKVFLYFY